MVCQKISLALGGGGARGLAHLGVIEGLKEEGFEIERLVGVSIGSIAGALYAFDPNIRRVQHRILDYLNSDGFRQHQERLFASQRSDNEQAAEAKSSWWRRLRTFVRANYVCRRVLLQRSILPGDLLRHAAENLLPDDDIANARIPLSVVAVDLLAGEPVILEEGPVRTAIRASASIPGVFPPVKLDGRLLCDIGVLNSVPTLATCTYQTGCLIAVDVSSAIRPITKCETAVDVLVRMNNVGEHMFRRYASDFADVVIQPDVGHIPWFDFSSAEQLIKLGRDAARQAVSRVRTACCERPSNGIHDANVGGHCLSSESPIRTDRLRLQIGESCDHSGWSNSEDRQIGHSLGLIQSRDQTHVGTSPLRG